MDVYKENINSKECGLLMQTDLEIQKQLGNYCITCTHRFSGMYVTDNKFQEDTGYVIGTGNMHMNSSKIIELFDKISKHKLCLNGHIHLYKK